MKKKFIDIEKVIHSKSPKLLKRTPGFLIRYLKRTLHQNEINQVLEENKDLYNYDFCHNLVERFNINIEVEGLDKIPKTGGAIFVFNHPLGGMDAMSLIDTIYPIRQDIKFIVNDLLLNLENASGLFIGVNKHGKNSAESLQEVNDAFASDQAIFIFPAGLVSRKKKGIVEDLEWKKTFITRAKKFNKPVIPIHVDGNLTKFFYRLANFRTAIGIKANLEMLYLADEQFKLKNKTIRITFGDKIESTTFDNSKSDKEWAQWVKQIVYSLPHKS